MPNILRTTPASRLHSARLRLYMITRNSLIPSKCRPGFSQRVREDVLPRGGTSAVPGTLCAHFRPPVAQAVPVVNLAGFFKRTVYIKE